MNKIWLALFLCIPICGIAQSKLLSPQLELLGSKMDSLKFTDYIINEPSTKNFNNKYKILEFWATWCKPCLEAVPHLNKLQNKFKDKDVVFLSITYESPKKTLSTLKKVDFQTIVVSDTLKVTHKNLRIEYNGFMPLPRTVLIDNFNRIVWFGSPEKLTEKLIDRFLKGEQKLD